MKDVPLIVLLMVLACCACSAAQASDGDVRAQGWGLGLRMGAGSSAGPRSAARRLRHHTEMREATDDELPPLAAVYNMFILPQVNWRAIVEGQLRDLNRSGLADHALVYVVISCPTAHQPFQSADHSHAALLAALHEARALVFQHLRPAEGASWPQRSGAVVHLIQDNAFEYHGQATLWLLAQLAPDNTLLLYVHTKGMSHSDGGRNYEEQIMMNGTVLNWRKYVNMFKTNPTATRAGLWCGDVGQLWGTFFWVRASRARQNEVLRTVDRYYYEGWVAIDQNAPDDVTNNEGNTARAPGQVFHGPEGCFNMCAYHKNGTGLGVGDGNVPVECLNEPADGVYYVEGKRGRR